MNKRNRNSILMLCMLLLTLSLSGCGKDKAEAIQESVITVETVKAERMDIARTAEYSGIIRGSNEVQIVPKVSSRVIAVHVNPGDTVNNGQVLLSLDNSDLEVAIKQAEAQLAQARAAQRSNEINLESARLNYERMLDLYNNGGISQQQMEAARDQYQLLNAGTVEASVAQAEAALLSLQKQWENCNITAPINGVVGSINVSLGDITNPAMPVAVVSNTDNLEIEVMVSESEISYIQAGSEVDVLVEAVSEKAFKGKVKSISTIADPASRNYGVKIDLSNNEDKMKSGMFAEVSIDTFSKNEVLCIPIQAVVPKGARSMVYTIDENMRAVSKEVETGISSDKYIEILSGLVQGQELVTKGNTLINDGALLKVAGGTK